MKSQKSAVGLSILAVIGGVLLCLAPGVNAQSRDYLTVEEIELVRDAQEIDKRISVLISAIDRRFSRLGGQNWQPAKKDADKWGDLPTASRMQLLSDISRILEKAIDDIDDLAARRSQDDKVLSVEKQDELDDVTAGIIKTNNSNFSLAVHNLADASRRYLPLLDGLSKESKDKKEQGLITGSIESCNLIIEAAETTPRPAARKSRKNGN